MITQNRGTIAFAVCGSFCTLEAALQSARALTAQGWQLLPVMSFAARQDTRFGTGNYWKEQLEAAAGHPVLDTLQAVEPLGPRKMAQALVVAPCTGATLSRLAAGLSDTPVTLAAKSLLRVGCPVVLAVSTNDGLGASGENIARLFQRKHYYFVPYGQDDPAAKPQSLKADFARLPAALEAALHGEQLQPVLLGTCNGFSAGAKCGILKPVPCRCGTTGSQTSGRRKPDEKTDHGTLCSAAYDPCADAWRGCGRSGAQRYPRVLHHRRGHRPCAGPAEHE